MGKAITDSASAHTCGAVCGYWITHEVAILYSHSLVRHSFLQTYLAELAGGPLLERLLLVVLEACLMALTQITRTLRRQRRRVTITTYNNSRKTCCAHRLTQASHVCEGEPLLRLLGSCQVLQRSNMWLRHCARICPLRCVDARRHQRMLHCVAHTNESKDGDRGLHGNLHVFICTSPTPLDLPLAALIFLERAPPAHVTTYVHLAEQGLAQDMGLRQKGAELQPGISHAWEISAYSLE
eukprot:3262675-Amphidinium_carterae.1